VGPDARTPDDRRGTGTTSRGPDARASAGPLGADLTSH
jgi:hypothetical protein